MTNLSATPVRSTTLPVPGAELYHEVRGEGPLVVLVGAPMGLIRPRVSGADATPRFASETRMLMVGR